MKFLHHVIVFCLYYYCLCKTSGQVHENTIPFSATENLPAITHFLDLPPIDSSLCKNNAGFTQSLTKQFQFACPIYTDLDPDNSGQWTETHSGSVWRLGIRSRNAYSLYINMRYFLSPGAKIFVYSSGYQDLRGAFTSRNNNPAKVLSIAPVCGDRLGLSDAGLIWGWVSGNNVLNVYSNPCSNSVTLDMPDRIPINDIKCFDNNGRSMSVNLRQFEDGNKLYFNLRPGIYHLKIITAEKSFVARFIVMEE